MSLIILHQPCGNAEAQYEQPACHRIQRAGVADAFLTTPTPDVLHNVVAGRQLRGSMLAGVRKGDRTARFIDKENSM